MTGGERGFQSAVIQLAELLGWRVYHAANVHGQLRAKSSVGFPDLVLARRNVIYRELKTNKGVLTPAQNDWQCWLAEAGADVDVWRPLDWPRIEEELK